MLCCRLLARLIQFARMGREQKNISSSLLFRLICPSGVENCVVALDRDEY
jgi:hypothetical protein